MVSESPLHFFLVITLSAPSVVSMAFMVSKRILSSIMTGPEFI